MQLQVARIGKPHGIRGEVTVQVMTDAPGDRFVPGVEFVVEPAQSGPLTVSSARWNKDILLLAFEEIEDRNQAETLRGAKLFIETAELDEDDEDAWGVDELDELEDEDSDDEGSDGEADEEDAEEEKIVKDADAAESEPVNQVKDSEIDDLAAALGKTELK